MVTLDVRIVGRQLPGRQFCDYEPVYVGLGRGDTLRNLTPAMPPKPSSASASTSSTVTTSVISAGCWCVAHGASSLFISAGAPWPPTASSPCSGLPNCA
jgi:hypothetical protein